MTSKAEVYRARAREAEIRASLSRDPEIKRQFEDIAREWNSLAVAIEGPRA